MATPNRRVNPKIIADAVNSLNGLKAIPNYSSPRPEAATETLTTAYNAMLAKQEEETVAIARAKSAADAARQAEWEFYDGILAMREVVRGLYGSDSNEAQSIGLKKKSERKRPVRNGSGSATP